MTEPEARADRQGVAALIAKAVTAWALLGGAVLIALVAVNVASVVGTAIGRTLPGDYELTEMGIAVAVFAFLPYCQLTDANVTADIFTEGAGPRVKSALRALACLIALIFAVILVWRMSYGLIDQRNYGYSTTILSVPIWWAFVPALISLVLLIAASGLTLVEATRDARAGRAS